MAAGLTLVCPVRGRLKAKAKSADGLRPSEERLRVEALRHLVDRGYPVANIKVEAVIKKFGHGGKNSFRADFAVLDQPVASLPAHDADEILRHALVLGEVKRDNSDASAAKSFQVRPMLDFATRDDCAALYWDDVEQRVYWITRVEGRKVEHEGPLATLPQFGEAIAAPNLTFESIDSNKPLLAVFKRIEDILHSASVGPQRRYGVILQLLLAKLYDEHQHEASPATPLAIQDFAARDVDPVTALSLFNGVLAKAVKYFKSFLPEPVPDSLQINAHVLLEVLRVLAPIKVVAMKQSVIQDFYMYFARHLYKWDLAQYFTPTSVTDFVIEILNPQFGEHIRDPACGSADFLTAAFRRRQHWPDYASSVWGSDVSPEAVQVAVLNMILNGDGKTNIREEDSLVKIVANQESCDIVVCNPPFGMRIVEHNPETLANFDLGHKWEADYEEGGFHRSDILLPSQEAGVLFAEACVRMVRPGGRVALVVPNGYLGNRSLRYRVLREWLLRHCRVAVLVGLPRFAFKGSGASVAASLLFLERRERPLGDATDDVDYEFSLELVDRVGWDLGDTQAQPVYQRDETDGTFLVDANDELIVDSDFAETLGRIRSSDAAEHFSWLRTGLPPRSTAAKTGWTVSAEVLLQDQHRTLDPKRYSRKVTELRADILSKKHFWLADVLIPVPERHSADGKKVSISAEKVWKYVEIADVSMGSFRWNEMRGWELPSRGKHVGEPGDLYIGTIWSCVQKWFFLGENAPDLIVTNGFHRFRLLHGKEEFLLDIVVGLCSEAFATQMRGFARGSDGLAEVPVEDALRVVLPVIITPTVRAELQPFVDQLRSGHTTLEAKVSSLLADERLPIPVPPRRPSHSAIV